MGHNFGCHILFARAVPALPAPPERSFPHLAWRRRVGAAELLGLLHPLLLLLLLLGLSLQLLQLCLNLLLLLRLARARPSDRRTRRRSKVRTSSPSRPLLLHHLLQLHQVVWFYMRGNG